MTDWARIRAVVEKDAEERDQYIVQHEDGRETYCVIGGLLHDAGPEGQALLVRARDGVMLNRLRITEKGWAATARKVLEKVYGLTAGQCTVFQQLNDNSVIQTVRREALLAYIDKQEALP